MLSQREQSQRTIRRVLEEYQSSGALPGPFVRFIQASSFKRSGRLPTYDEVERYVEEWVPKWLAEIDEGADPSRAATE